MRKLRAKMSGASCTRNEVALTARRGLGRFFGWYERHYLLNVSIAAGLFVLQVVHLGWLSGDVVAERAGAEPLLSLDGAARVAVALVDYTEVPALLSVSLVYVNELRKRLRGREVALLALLNTQWLHLFWITDEFVVAAGRAETTLPAWLAWVAIAIDYLELPVMLDTVRRALEAVVGRRPSAVRVRSRPS